MLFNLIEITADARHSRT